MADERKDRDKWADAVTRLIELTQRGEMRWSSTEPKGTASEEENRTSAVFQSDYNGKTLRLYEKKVQERRQVDAEQPMVLSSIFGKYTYVWVPQVVLEFIDAKGATLWRFPHARASRDLLAAVQYQVAGVSEFLNGLFNETTAA